MSPPIRLRRLSLALMLAALLAPRPAAAEARLASWGFRAGWSGARLGGDGGKVIAPDFRSDFTASWFVTARLRPGLWFQPEMSWTSKGGQDDFSVASYPSPTTVTVTEFHVEHRLDYLEVPLLVRVDLPALGAIEPYALGGPAPAWLVGEDDSEIAITGSVTSVSRAARASAQIFEELGTAGAPLPARMFDLGLVGGLGFWVGSGRVRVGVEGRYTYGVLDMVPGGEFEFHNHAIAITTALEVR